MAHVLPGSLARSVPFHQMRQDAAWLCLVADALADGLPDSPRRMRAELEGVPGIELLDRSE